MKLKAMLTILASCAVLATACGSSRDARTIDPDHAPNLSVLNQSAGQLSHGAKSPEELIKRRDPPVIITGSIAGVDKGRDIYLSRGAKEEGVEPQPFVVIQVRVKKTLQEKKDDQVVAGRVYVETRQGSAGPDGKPAKSLSEWREALPVGTHVIFFLHENLVEENSYPTEHDDRGHPDKAELLIFDPQGALFEYNGKLLSRKPGGGKDGDTLGMDSIKEISNHVEQYLAHHG